MLKKNQAFNFGFAVLFIVHLMSTSELLSEIFLFPYANLITKPMIALSLLGLLLVRTGFRGRFAKRIGLGLLFGWFGDIFLMIKNQNEIFFILGLASFLIGHLFYAFAFYLDYQLNKTAYKGHSKNAIIAYAFFVVILVALLWSHLGGMKIPVILYALTISFMGVMAVNRYGRVNTLSYQLSFFGSILFVISDSVLAINMFMHPLPFAGMAIMSTYMAAQYLITMSILERKIKKKVEDV